MPKLHLCCGDVYLVGYINIDIMGRKLRRGEVNCNLTTLDKYYIRPFSSKFTERKRGEFIIDKKMSIIERWDFDDSSIDEIVMISALEHFSKDNAYFIVSEAKRVLCLGKRFIFDFPDILDDMWRYYYINPNWLMELIYCNNKNEYSTHKWGYTRKTIKELLGNGWKIRFKTVVKHNYPMIGVEATKL